MLAPALSQGELLPLSPSALTTPLYLETAISREVNLTNLKSHLAREHVGIEIMFAVASGKALTSRFGHVFLRFIDRDDDPYNDTVVGFAFMDVVGRDPGIFDFLGPGSRLLLMLPSADTMARTLVYYQNSDKRDLQRYIVPAFPEQIVRLKEVILSVAVAPDLMGAYDLIRNNCMTALKKILTTAGFPMFPTFFADTMFFLDNYIESSLISPYPTSPFMTIKGIESFVYPLLEQAENEWLDRFHEPLEYRQFIESRRQSVELAILALPTFPEVLARQSDYVIGKLVNYWPREWRAHLPTLLKIYRDRKLDVYSFKNFTELPVFEELIYRACRIEDKRCRESRTQAALRVWSIMDLENRQNRLSEIFHSESKRAQQLPAGSEGGKAHHSYLRTANTLDNVHFLRINP